MKPGRARGVVPDRSYEYRVQVRETPLTCASMLIARSTVVGLVVVATFVACASRDHAAAPPIDIAVGDLRIHVAPDSANVSVEGPDGTPLLEGIDASNDVGAPQSANDDAPPMTGFAVREVATSYQMLFGAFKVVDAPVSPWRVVRRARVSDANVDLIADDGARVASLAFSIGQDAENASRHLVVDVTPGEGPERRFSWGFRCKESDRFFGFGEQTWGIDARKETLPIFVTEEGIGKDLTTDDPTASWFSQGRRHSSQMPLPEFLSRRGFIVVADTALRSTFAMCSERDDVARMELELPVTLHLFYGPSTHDAIAGMTAKFGRPRVPPAFAFAPWNDAIFGSANVRRVAKKLRDAGAPSSVIWTEDWRGADQEGDHYALKEEWDVDRSLYPDFESVAKELHGEGFKWLVYFNPFVEKDSKAWPETAPNGMLVRAADGTPYTFGDAKFRDASLVDLSDPNAAAWATAKMKAAIALGADGWMGDYAEWLPTDATLAGGTGLALHNRYPLLWQEAQRKALDDAIAADGVERLSFVRSGWLGTPALADVFWAGDQRTDFEIDDGMPTVVPIGLGVGLAGVSTFGSDIGGYQNQGNAAVTKELFFRWTELGAWSPVMRTHHGSFPKLNWNFESDDETLAHWVRYAKLHMALAPYMRGLAQAAHDTGVSIWRALAIEFPDDDAAWSIADEAMVGERLLVAPVQGQGLTSRNVHLPQGTWFPWNGGAHVDAGDATANAALGEIPVFARAGAIVPMYPDGVETLVNEASTAKSAKDAAGDRTVIAFAGASSTFAEAPASSGATASLVYSLDSATLGDGPVTRVTWNDAPLAACASAIVAPCFESGAAFADGVRAHVAGPGALVVVRGADTVATLTIRGGDAARALVLIVRM